ncbi:MAG: phosphonate ABC transporter ATP-binding protein [Cyanobacteria bacterium REEB65]|nr:phosphonate ABC transporter ATP-binding protein [Cyanobacteria bacterium REEB65]
MISVRNLCKQYGTGALILKDVSLDILPGQFTTILGLSGAGKSTFLRCLNRLIEPTGGEIRVPAELLGRSGEPLDVARAGAGDLRRWRRRVGMIFQQFNLAKRLTVLDNVLSGTLGYAPWALSSLRVFSADDKARACKSLERVGLLPFAYQRADTLSGGQQQRVAIARALMQRPAVILADEPVASLDPKLSMTILALLAQICREDNIAVLVSLHVLELAKRYSERMVGFAGGEIVFDGRPESLDEGAIRRIYQAKTEELKAYPIPT